MRRALAVLALLSLPALAALPVRRWSLAQPATGTAPDASTPCTTEAQGLPMNGLGSYYVCVTSASGLGGAGTLQAYFWDAHLQDAGFGWAREPGADESVTSSGVNAQCFPSRLLNGGNWGCARWVPSSVSTGDGGGVTVSAVGVFR